MATDMIVIPYDRIKYGNRERIRKIREPRKDDPEVSFVEKKHDRIFTGRWPFNKFGKALDELLAPKKGIFLDKKLVDQVDYLDITIWRIYEICKKESRGYCQIGKLEYSVGIDIPVYDNLQHHGDFSPHEVTWHGNEPYFSGQTLLNKFRTCEKPWETIDIEANSLPLKFELLRDSDNRKQFNYGYSTESDEHENKSLQRELKAYLKKNGFHGQPLDNNQALTIIDCILSYVLK